jgi:hypothetical protein
MSEENKLTLVSQKNSWIKATSENLNFDVTTILKETGAPIRTRQDLDNRLRLLAVHILKFVDIHKTLKKTVAQYFLEIKEAAERLGYDKETLKRIAEEIFRQYGISDSHIRKVIPHELKDQSHTNLRYRPNQTEAIEEYNASDLSAEDLPSDTEIQLKNAIERIKELEVRNRSLEEQLANSIMIGQETKVYRGKVALDRDRNLPLIVAINLKDDRLEYIEIDTEEIRRASEANA